MFLMKRADKGGPCGNPFQRRSGQGDAGFRNKSPILFIHGLEDHFVPTRMSGVRRNRETFFPYDYEMKVINA